MILLLQKAEAEAKLTVLTRVFDKILFSAKLAQKLHANCATVNDGPIV